MATTVNVAGLLKPASACWGVSQPNTTARSTRLSSSSSRGTTIVTGRDGAAGLVGMGSQFWSDYCRDDRLGNPASLTDRTYGIKP